MYYIVVLAIAAVLGIIPGNLAKEKGYSFGLWWFYGWMLFIVAIIHVQFIPNKNVSKMVSNNDVVDNSFNQSAVNELKMYKELFDQGVISEEEFQIKKEQLLKVI